MKAKGVKTKAIAPEISVSDDELTKLAKDMKDKGEDAIYQVLRSEGVAQGVENRRESMRLRRETGKGSDGGKGNARAPKAAKPMAKTSISTSMPVQKLLPKKPAAFLCVKGFSSARDGKHVHCLDGTYARVNLTKNSPKSIHFDQLYKRLFLLACFSRAWPALSNRAH